MNTDAAFGAIAKDLNIIKYASESSSSFRARIAYSAVGMWIRMFAASSPESDGGLSKSLIHRKSSSIIKNFVRMDKDLEKWFYPSEATNPENIMRNVLLRSGDLCEGGFDGKVKCMSTKVMSISSEAKVATGYINPSNVKIMSGLSCIPSNNNHPSTGTLLDLFHIPFVPAEDLINKSRQNAHWSKIGALDNYEIFDPSRKKVLSSCWSKFLPLNPSQVYMARRQYSFGVFDYQLLKMENDSYLVSSFSDYEQNEFVRDTQRLLYALKAVYGTPTTAICEIEQTHAVFHFWSKLPPAEDFLLRYIGWPLENIENAKSEFVVRKEYVDLVKAITKNLNIKVEEHRHE